MIRLDPDGGAVLIELEQGASVQVEGLAANVVVERAEQRALFLDQSEAETLGKMIDYILEKVRITEPSRAALEAVRPRLRDVFDA